MDYFHAKRFLDVLPDWEKGTCPDGPLEHYLPRMRALLAHLENPQECYTSIIVGGTNGKGTVSSLLAALLAATGHRVGLYTSPHLHTWRERVQVDGRLLDRDSWAEAITLLYDRSRNFAEEGLGRFSRYEALTALAAQLFAVEKVEYAVFEVGLGGRYDAANAWGADVAVLAPVGLDHLDVLGPGLLDIAADKLEIARAGRPLFTTAQQSPEVLDLIRQHCQRRQINLYIAGDQHIEATQEQGLLSYIWQPVKAEGRPRTYRQNARLALAAARFILGEKLDVHSARTTVLNHWWPGRFEVVRKDPFVLLDGAHNPAAMAALKEDLETLAPRWTFLVGVNAGHDVAGLLRELKPLAQRVVLTASDHPRAIDVRDLVASAPVDLPVEVGELGRSVFERIVGSLQPGDKLCITGSLHLVARAREFFNVPYEREGISEDVALESLTCIEMACRRREMPFERISENEQVVRLLNAGRPLYFWRNKHPFNDYVSARLAEDKIYQYELFVKADIPTPYTLPVFNPYADDRFNRYKTHVSIDEILAHINAQFSYPLLVKKNRSSLSQGVFLEHSPEALEQRLRTLFENSGFLDNLVLVQTRVVGPEYRIIGSGGELLLAYEKQGEKRETGDLNPLHGERGRAAKVEGEDLLSSLAELTGRIARVIDLGFYAIDLIAAETGFWVLELNPNPFCYFYNRDNGRRDFVGIYEGLLAKYLSDGANESVETTPH